MDQITNWSTPIAELKIRLVSKLQEALVASDIRNTGRHFMTHDQKPISHDQQAKWFYEQYRPEHHKGNLHLFAGYIAGEPAAYGLVVRRVGDYWVTGVISPEYRGQGYGKQLFEHMGNYVFETLDADVITLDVLPTNMPARKLYESLGYQYKEQPRVDGTLVMRKVRDDAREK